jgi:hypothetical protein
MDMSKKVELARQLKREFESRVEILMKRDGLSRRARDR